MRKLYTAIIFTGIIFASSCATVFNGDRQLVTVASDKTIKDFSIKNGTAVDSFSTENITAKQYYVDKNMRPLNIGFLVGDSVKTYSVQPYLSPLFWLNIPLTRGSGMFVDMATPQRFDYRSYYLFSANDSDVYEKKTHPTRDEMLLLRTYQRKNRIVPPTKKKGRIDLRLSWLFVNDIDIKQNQTNLDRTAPLAGFGVGVDYYTKPKQYISADFGAAATYLDGVFPDTTSNVAYWNVKYNHIIGRFQIGYGIHLSSYTLRFETRDTTTLPINYLYDDYHNYSLGLSLSAQFGITRFMNIGVQTQPNIISLSKREAGMKYRSNTSVYVNFTLPVKK